MDMIPATVSPCVGACGIDETTGLCGGCARTGEEIANWRTEDGAFRQKVWNELPDRFEKLGISCQRLPWDQTQISSFVMDSLRQKSGTWLVGAVGAVAEFMPMYEDKIFVSRSSNEIKAETANARLHFNISEDARALKLSTANAESTERIILACNRKESGLLSAGTITHLGADFDAIDENAQDKQLFDLGLGRTYMRFCIRTDNPELLNILSKFEGRNILEVYENLAPPLIATSPERIVESALGRLEIATTIPKPDEKTAPGYEG